MTFKLIQAILILAFLNLSLYAKTTKELVTILANSSMSIQYYFFAKNNKAYLSKPSSGSAYAVWHYTSAKKWQPVHNAGAFDGFLQAGNVFDSVSINAQRTKISIGSIIGSDINSDVSYLAQNIENSTIDIGWYFWTVGTNIFLLAPKSDNTISIWSYTVDRKWQPIHNAGASDDFPSIGKTLDNINFNPATNTLQVGNVNSSLSNTPADTDRPAQPAPTLPAGYKFSSDNRILYENGEAVDMTNPPEDLKEFLAKHKYKNKVGDLELPAGYKFDASGNVLYENGEAVDMTNPPQDLLDFLNKNFTYDPNGKSGSMGAMPKLPDGYKFSSDNRILYDNGTEVDMANPPQDLKEYMRKYFTQVNL